MKINLNYKHPNFLLAMFFLPYVGSTFFAYIFIYLYLFFNLMKLRLRSWEYFLLLLYPIFIILKVQQVGVSNGELIFRFFLGFIPIYYFFKIYKTRINISLFIYLLCYAIILEAFLINTVISPTLLGNYPSQEVFEISHQTSFLGFYQRPYGIGCNSTITSSILSLSLFFLRKEVTFYKLKWNKWIDVLTLVAILLLASGTGFFLYIIYVFYRYNLISLKKSLLGILIGYILWGIITNIDLMGAESILKKISLEYINLLIEFKQEQMVETINELNSTSLIIGSDFSNSPLLLWNDFAIRDFFHTFGFMGIIVFCIFILCRLNNYNKVFIVIAIISLFHYGSIFSFSGQLLFAYILKYSEELHPNYRVNVSE